MLTKREWNHEPEVFEAIAEALEDSRVLIDHGAEAIAREEESSYRDEGYVYVEMDGRRFYLQLWEEL